MKHKISMILEAAVILSALTGCGAAVHWALQQPGVKRVEAETEPDNRASRRVLEKCGFLPTGTFGEDGPQFFRG